TSLIFTLRIKIHTESHLHIPSGNQFMDFETSCEVAVVECNSEARIKDNSNGKGDRNGKETDRERVVAEVHRPQSLEIRKMFGWQRGAAHENNRK
ncbi:unnamed protein product, partial [Acanthocheilonema viteae]